MSDNKKYDGWAGLCEKCSSSIFTLMAKLCPKCKKNETNSCFERCASCARRLDKCSYCNGKL